MCCMLPNIRCSSAVYCLQVRDGVQAEMMLKQATRIASKEN